MERLIEGYKKFITGVFPQRRELYHLLADSQAPEYLFITCADSRVVPDQILGTGPGDLFIARNVGHVVPAAGAEPSGVTATIEYAVEVLRVRHVIVCGHSDCGAMKAAVERKNIGHLPQSSRWLAHVEAAFNHKQPLNPADGESAEMAALIRGNVVAQLHNLREQPSVACAMQEGRLAVHGWYYDILSGRIEQYDERTRRFAPLID